MTGQGETTSPALIRAVLLRLGLLADADLPLRCEPLAGGVSSDIWRVESGVRRWCFKRALPKLRVAADWQVPVERSCYEARWLEVAQRLAPGAAPQLYGYDAPAQALVMAYLDPEQHPVWKGELRDGRIDAFVAGALAARLAAIHRGTAGDARVAAQFPTDALFHALRLEPYLVEAARRHPRVAERLDALVATTAATRLALVHGDVSPKNILVGPAGPVLLDAECAWYGDPAFDLAFCLNHLLLKCAWRPANAVGYLQCFDALAGGYLEQVDWEPPAALERRAAALLPALMLARVDGKSPVEYLTDDADRERVRRFALARVAQPAPRVADIAAEWGEAVRQ